MKKLSLLILAVSILSVSITKLIAKKNNMIEVKPHWNEGYKVDVNVSSINEVKSNIIKLPYKEEKNKNTEPIKSNSYPNVDNITKLSDCN